MPAFDPLLEWFGIPPRLGAVDYYTLLGLRRFERDEGLIFQAIQARRLFLQRQLHGPHEKEARELLAILGEVQACFLDPTRKAAYDRKLRSQLPPRGPSAKEIATTHGEQGPSSEPNLLRADLASPDHLPKATEQLAAEDGPPLLSQGRVGPRQIGTQASGSKPTERRVSGSKPSSASYGRPTTSPALKPVTVVISEDRSISTAERVKLAVLAIIGVAGLVFLCILIAQQYRFSLRSSPSRKPLAHKNVSPSDPTSTTLVALSDPAAAAPAHQTKSQQEEGQKVAPAGVQVTAGESAAAPIGSETLKSDTVTPLEENNSSSRELQQFSANLGAASKRAESDVGSEHLPDLGLEQAADNLVGAAMDQPPQEPTQDGGPGQQAEPVLPKAPAPGVRELKIPVRQVDNRAAAEALLQAGGVSTKSRLDSLASRMRHARDVLLLYQVFLESEGIAEKEKEEARKYLPGWEKRAADDMLRLGDQWVTPLDWEQRKRSARESLRKGIHSIGLSDTNVIRELERASRLDPELISADFVLGLLYAVDGRNPTEARNCFRRCVQRQPDNLSAWNNLGICEFRLRSFESALRAFRKTVELGGSPEVTLNLALILAADRAKVVPIPPAFSRSFADLYTKVSSQFPESKAPTSGLNRGFLFLMPSMKQLVMNGVIDITDGGAVQVSLRGRSVAEDLRLVSFATGFVVAHGVILTSRFVAEAGDLFGIVCGSKLQRVGYAQLLAVPNDPDLDLALLKCDHWLGKPMPLRTESDYLPRGEPVALIHFSDSDSFTFELKARRGTVRSPPRMEGGLFLDQYFFHIAADLKSRGAPVVDETGTVVAVVSGGDLSEAVGQACGIPIQRAIQFMQEAHLLPQPVSGASGPQDIEQLTQLAQESVVLIQVLAVPFVPGRAGSGTSGQPRRVVGYTLLDQWCLRCNGRSVVDCSERRCGNGRISTTQERMLGRDPNTGRPIVIREPTTVLCPTCKGAGVLKCPVCRGSGLMN